MVKDTVLSDVDLASSVKCTVFEHYIQHATLSEEFPLELKNNFLLSIGQIAVNFENIKKCKLNIATGGDTGEENQLIANYRNVINGIF